MCSLSHLDLQSRPHILIMDKCFFRNINRNEGCSVTSLCQNLWGSVTLTLKTFKYGLTIGHLFFSWLNTGLSVCEGKTPPEILLLKLVKQEILVFDIWELDRNPSSDRRIPYVAVIYLLQCFLSHTHASCSLSHMRTHTHSETQLMLKQIISLLSLIPTEHVGRKILKLCNTLTENMRAYYFWQRKARAAFPIWSLTQFFLVPERILSRCTHHPSCSRIYF